MANQPTSTGGGFRLRRLCFAALAVAMCLGLSEAALRLMGLRPYSADLDVAAGLRPLHWVLPGDPIVYVLRPGSVSTVGTIAGQVTYRINRLGLRGPEVTLEKPADVRRILLLGDSVAFGFGVAEEHTFAARLRSAYRDSADGLGGAKIEVLNAGVGGYSTYNEREYYVSRGRGFQPDYVVLCFCPNDVDSPLLHFEFNTTGVAPDLPSGAIPNTGEFQQHLAARQAHTPPGCPWVRAASRRGIRSSALLYAGYRLTCPHPTAVRQYARCVEALAHLDSPELAWLRRELESLESATRESGAWLGVVVIPLAWQITGGAESETALRNVASVCRESGVPCLDVRGALRIAGAASHTYIDSSHLSERGHAIVASEVRQWLDQLGPGAAVPE